MRVLLWMIDAGIIPGGHRVQIEQTGRHLRELGIDVDVSFAPTADVAAYDIVHGYLLPPRVIRECRRAGVRVVLSTIYWDRAYTMNIQESRRSLRHWEIRGRIGVSLMLSALRGRHIDKTDVLLERLTKLRLMYESADLLLPNSHAEAAAIAADLGISTPCHIVPNSVDPSTFNLSDEAAGSSALPDGDSNRIRDGVLYAGRFEPHKNQLGLIRAMKGSSLKTLLVGPEHRDHIPYRDACRKLAERSGGRIEVLPGVPHEELPPLYRRAKVHVLPSRFETTGLVSLEAALCGCNIVTTQRGYAREYFGDLAWYCDPSDPRSIREAVEAAHLAPYRRELREKILGHYTWVHTARATAEGYRMILNLPAEAAGVGSSVADDDFATEATTELTGARL